MTNPFHLLDIPEDADDAAIKKAYLKKVREYPPEHDPEQFQAIRTAFEAIKSHRNRLRYHLFQQDSVNIDDLVQHALWSAPSQRPTKHQLLRVLAESLGQTK